MTIPLLLTQDAICQLAKTLDGWTYDEEKCRLHKRFIFDDYATSLAWVNDVSVIAEAQNHHPAISFGWGYVNIWITTHDADGVTQRDVAFVTAVEGL